MPPCKILTTNKQPTYFKVNIVAVDALTGKAKSDAERARAYRQRKKQSMVVSSAAHDLQAHQLLAEFITELGAYATVMPSEKWVAKVRAHFGIKI